MDKYNLLYQCDPRKAKDCSKSNCFYAGTGECKTTANEAHAITGPDGPMLKTDTLQVELVGLPRQNGTTPGDAMQYIYRVRLERLETWNSALAFAVTLQAVLLIALLVILLTG